MSRSDPLAEFPEFTALDGAERRAWEAAFRARERRHLRGLQAMLFILVLSLGLGLISCAGNFLLAGLEALRLSHALSIAVMAALLSLMGLVMYWVIHRTKRALLHDAMIARVRRGRADCAGCGYDLSAAAGVDTRPGVVRCPECGLINPSVRPDSDAQLR